MQIDKEKVHQRLFEVSKRAEEKLSDNDLLLLARKVGPNRNHDGKSREQIVGYLFIDLTNLWLKRNWEQLLPVISSLEILLDPNQSVQ